MIFSRMFSAALVVGLLFAQGEPAEATPESSAGALFLLISPSVRVNGMGQAGVALSDEPAGYYNPGAAALSFPARTLQSRFYLSEMQWLGEATYSYFATQVAAERVLDSLPWKGPTRLRAAFYGYRTKIDIGELPPHKRNRYFHRYGRLQHYWCQLSVEDRRGGRHRCYN